MNRSSAITLLCVGLCAAGSASAQDDLRLELEAAFPVGFGLIGGVRPLSDGRVIVADPLGQVLVRLDMDAGAADTLGRFGSGPQEYRQPDGVFALPADSTLLVDLGNGRLTVIAPDGRFGSTTPIARSTARGGLAIVLPRGTDAAGRVYYEPDDATSAEAAGAVVRLDRAAASIDTVALLRQSESEATTRGATVMRSGGPFLSRDSWAVSPEGRVGVVRAEDYSVEWILTSGRRVRGPAGEVTRVAVGRAEKEAWLDHFFSGVSVGLRRGEDGSRTVTFSRGSSAGAERDLGAFEWPDRMPAFRADRTVASDGGELWVERYGPAGEAPLVDVFNSDGERVGKLALPAGRRVAALVAGVAYLVLTDAYGLEWLERYAVIRPS